MNTKFLSARSDYESSLWDDNLLVVNMPVTKNGRLYRDTPEIFIKVEQKEKVSGAWVRFDPDNLNNLIILLSFYKRYITDEKFRETNPLEWES